MGVFEPTVEGRSLSFRPDGERIVDAETGSTWDLFGRATDGALVGKQLSPVVSGSHSWFAWAAFTPQTRLVQD